MATNLAASLRSVMGISTTAISASIRIHALYGTPMLADSLLWGFPAWNIPSFHIDIPDSNWLESSSSLMPIAPTSQGGFYLSLFFRNVLDPLNRIGRRSCPSDGFQLVAVRREPQSADKGTCRIEDVARAVQQTNVADLGGCFELFQDTWRGLQI